MRNTIKAFLNKTIRSILILTLLSSNIGFAIPAYATGQTVNVWLTTTEGANNITQKNNITFTPDTGTTNPTIEVNDTKEYQQITGFGGAMTDTSAYLLGGEMNQTQKDSVMNALFSPTTGIGLNFVRIPIGSSDYTATPPTAPNTYSYDDLPAGQTDPTLYSFSITHDLAYIIPLLQQAQQINPSIKFMANTWSAPAWMKTNGSMLGTYNNQQGTLIPAYYDAFARYLIKFITEYQSRGIPIYMISPQNEPGYAPDSYAGMLLSAQDEANFIKNNLGPALQAAQLPTKIIAYDNVWYDGGYVQTLLNDSTARNYIQAVAWHCYFGDPSAMSTIHSQYTTLEMHETECSTGPNGIAPMSAIDLTLRSVQNFAQTVQLWNLVLDTNGGPKMGQGCGGCTGLVTVNQATGNSTFTQNYYQLGQVSKFVKPGAIHIGSSVPWGLDTAAFKNPDGSKVLVVHNNGFFPSTFKVRWNGTQAFLYTLPVGAVVTFQWSGTASGTTSPFALNAGGNAINNYKADAYYSGGSTSSTSASINTTGVINPAPQEVYQTSRVGNGTYTLSQLLPGASYKVRLHFSENTWTKTQQRLFHVIINGTRVLSNFDVFATAGAKNKAVVREFTATADGNGIIIIQFSNVKDNATINGIELTPQAYAINAGGWSSGTFQSDTYAIGGGTFGTWSSINTTNVVNPAPQSVYQSERNGDFNYHIPNLLPGVSYKVRLHFAEIYWGAANLRLFDARINNVSVLSNFDVYTAADGINKALVKEFITNADTNGSITIDFTTIKDKAKISGIEILVN